MNIFKKAMEQKLRFVHRGIITTEDLFDLSVEALDSIYGGLAADLNSINGVSLLNKQPNPMIEEIELKMEIIKVIVEEKQDVAKEAKEAAIKAAKKQRVLEALAKKQEQELYDMSAEELNALLEEM